MHVRSLNECFGEKSGKNVLSHSQLSISTKQCVYTRAWSIRFIMKKTLQLIKLQLQIVILKEEDKSLCWHSDCCYIDATLLPYQIRLDFLFHASVWVFYGFFFGHSLSIVCMHWMRGSNGIAIAGGAWFWRKGSRIQKQPSMSKQFGISLLIPFISWLHDSLKS